jgi:nicotinamide-nucleotide amidase
MECSIISIGTEISLGITANTNATLISNKLSEEGIECRYMFTVRDSIDDIVKVLRYAIENSRHVILSGGLGPTDDDMTREAVSKALGVGLSRHRSLDPTSLRFLRDRLTEDLKKRLLRQSYVPEGAVPLIPKIGSASGFIAYHEKKDTYVYAMPGVPREMLDMLLGDVLPFLRKNISGLSDRLKKTVLYTTDISESEIEQKIKDIYPGAQSKGVRIGITAVPGIIKIMIISSSPDDSKNQRNLEEVEQTIYSRLGNKIYGRDGESMAYALKKAILGKNKPITVSAAESITGGLIGKIITDVQGSSDYFKGSIVSYSDYSKAHILKVKKEKMERTGAVSKEVCHDMAMNAKKIFDSDFAVAVTGFAGPDLSSNLTGLVYCQVIGPSIEKVYEKRFKGNREDIRFRTAQFILNQLRIEIERS